MIFIDDKLHLKELAEGKNMKAYYMANEIMNWFRRSPQTKPTTIQLVFIIEDLQSQLEDLVKNLITPFKIYVDFYVSVKSKLISSDESEIRFDF